MSSTEHLLLGVLLGLQLFGLFPLHSLFQFALIWLLALAAGWSRIIILTPGCLRAALRCTQDMLLQRSAAKLPEICCSNLPRQLSVGCCSPSPSFPQVWLGSPRRPQQRSCLLHRTVGRARQRHRLLCPTPRTAWLPGPTDKLCHRRPRRTSPQVTAAAPPPRSPVNAMHLGMNLL